MKTGFNRFAKTTAVAAFLFFTMSAFATPPVEVSNYLVRQFEHQFAGASNVTWKTTDQFTSASFIQDGKKVSVFYSPEGDLAGVSKVITVNDLPAKTQQKLATQYRDYTIMSVIDFVDAEGTTMYYVQLENNNQQSILQVDNYGSVSNFKK